MPMRQLQRLAAVNQKHTGQVGSFPTQEVPEEDLHGRQAETKQNRPSRASRRAMGDKEEKRRRRKTKHPRRATSIGDKGKQKDKTPEILLAQDRRIENSHSTLCLKGFRWQAGERHRDDRAEHQDGADHRQRPERKPMEAPLGGDWLYTEMLMAHLRNRLVVGWVHGLGMFGHCRICLPLDYHHQSGCPIISEDPASHGSQHGPGLSGRCGDRSAEKAIHRSDLVISRLARAIATGVRGASFASRGVC